jgi:hypothetical protein
VKPIMVELYAGLHGWGEAAIEEGFDVVGFDIVDMCKELGMPRPKGIQIVLQDVLTLHGSQFKNAAVIVASPPCQGYSYRAMPWKRAKALPPPDNTLFEACFRIQREACEATCHCECWRCKTRGHCVRCDGFVNTGKFARYIPLIVENVRGAQKWVGRSAWNYGSMYLWGDVPALMPFGTHKKLRQDNSPRMWSERRMKRITDGATDAFYRKGSASMSRKAASAMIAKIPYSLALHIARTFKPAAGTEGKG